MIESPFVEYCDKIDEKFFSEGAGLEQYYQFCIQMRDNRKTFPNENYIYDLFVEDIKHREKFRKNIIMSIEGDQGEGKSLFALYWAYFISIIFGEKFKIKDQLYVTPADLDEGLRNSPFRSTHLLDEQRKKKVGMGSISEELSLVDYEEQCRWTQKNIIYVSPRITDHSHYFIFTANNIQRIENKDFCAVCPKKIQDKCYKSQFETACSKEFIKRNGGKKIRFFERSGYPKSITFMLKTKRKIDNWVVPRGFITVPMVTPETVKIYDSIKAINILKLEKQEDEAFKYKDKIINDFIAVYKNNCIKLIGGISERTYKLKDEYGDPKLVTKVFDTRKYSVVSQDVIMGYLFEFLKAQHRFTTQEVKIMVSIIKEKYSTIVYDMNIALFREKREKDEK